MHAFRGKNGKILAPCVHSRVRSGGFGCMARKSCRQGRLFASRGPRSCMARRTCQRCSTSSWQRPVVCSNGLCALSPIPGLLDAWVHPCNPGRAHRYRYHALPLACDRRTACALPTPHPHPVPPADPAIASRQARAQATSRLGDTARNPLSRPAAPPASRGLRSPPTPLPRAPPPPALPPALHPSRRAPATRRTAPCRAGSAAVPVIPAKWCGDTIAHTRKLRF